MKNVVLLTLLLAVLLALASQCYGGAVTETVTDVRVLSDSDGFKNKAKPVLNAVKKVLQQKKKALQIQTKVLQKHTKALQKKTKKVTNKIQQIKTKLNANKNKKKKPLQKVLTKLAKIHVKHLKNHHKNLVKITKRNEKILKDTQKKLDNLAKQLKLLPSPTEQSPVPDLLRAILDEDPNGELCRLDCHAVNKQLGDYLGRLDKTDAIFNGMKTKDVTAMLASPNPCDCGTPSKPVILDYVPFEEGRCPTLLSSNVTELAYGLLMCTGTTTSSAAVAKKLTLAQVLKLAVSKAQVFTPGHCRCAPEAWIVKLAQDYRDNQIGATLGSK